MNTSNLVNILRKGKIAILPIDIDYSIVCDSTNDEAVRNVFLVKKRELTKPLVVLASDLEMVKKYTRKITPLEEEIINKFWPGPLTILLAKNSLVSDLVTASLPFVGVRVPDNKNLRDLIKRLGSPIAITSANIVKNEVVTDVSMLDPQLVKNVNYVCYGHKINTITPTVIRVNKDNKIEFLKEGKLNDKIKKDFKDYI